MASFISTNEVLQTLRLGVARLDVRTTNKVAAVGMNEGVFVCPSGTAGDSCEECDSAADVRNAIGVTMYNAVHEEGSTFYSTAEVVPILEEGIIPMSAEATVTQGAPVFARHTSDGGSNTELGKVRADSDLPSGGLTITPTATNDKYYTITLNDGSGPQTFTYLSDATATVAELCTGFTALIDASAEFSATDNTTDFQIDSTSGIVEVVSADYELPVTTPGRCERVPGAYFEAARTGAGLVEVQVGRTAGKA